MTARVDLDDTSRCPVAEQCDVDGGREDLAVDLVETPVGVGCVTRCWPCAIAGRLPHFPSWGDAILRVGEHCTHLGIDVDQMAAAMEADR